MNDIVTRTLTADAIFDASLPDNVKDVRTTKREHLRRALLRSESVVGSTTQSLKAVEAILHRCDPDMSGVVDRATFREIMRLRFKKNRNMCSVYRRSFSTPTFRSEFPEAASVLAEQEKAAEKEREERRTETLLTLLRDEIESRFGFHTLQRGFLCADADGNGSLDPKELERLLLRRNFHAGEEAVSAMVRACDLNSDGRISFEEFVRVVRGGPKENANGILLPGPPMSGSGSSGLMPGWNPRSAVTGSNAHRHTIRIFGGPSERVEEAASSAPPPALPKPTDGTSKTATPAPSAPPAPSNDFQDLLDQMILSPTFRRHFRFHDESIEYESLRQLLRRKISPLVAHMPTTLRPLVHRILSKCKQSATGLITYASCKDAVERAAIGMNSAVLSRDWDPTADYRNIQADPRTPPIVRAPWASHRKQVVRSFADEADEPKTETNEKVADASEAAKTISASIGIGNDDGDGSAATAAVPVLPAPHVSMNDRSTSTSELTTSSVLPTRPPPPVDKDRVRPTYDAAMRVESKQRQTRSREDTLKWAMSCIEDLRDRVLQKHAWIQRAFVHYDRDRSGSITLDELRIILRALNLDATDEELETLIAICFDEGSMDGRISFEEFAKSIHGQHVFVGEDGAEAKTEPELRSTYERQYKAPTLRSRHDAALRSLDGNDEEAADPRRYRPMFDSLGRRMYSAAEVPRRSTETRPMFDSRGRKKSLRSLPEGHVPSCLPGRDRPPPTEHETIYGCYAERNLRYLRKDGEKGYGSRVVRPRFPMPPSGNGFSTESHAMYQDPTEQITRR